MKTKRLLILASVIVCAISASAQFAVGMRDTRFVNINYTFKNHFNVKLEESVFSESFGYQTIRAYVGYKTDVGKFTISATPYFGTAWNGDYQSLGAQIGADYNPIKYFGVSAMVNPNYDTGFGYKTCYRVGANVRITDQVRVLVDYGNVPEYRESEDMLRAGVNFKVGNLTLTPMAGVKARGENTFRSIRILCNFNYSF